MPILHYHEASTHRLHRFAPSPGRLDWANQPDPFRRFAGAPVIELPLRAGRLSVSYDALHRPGAIPAAPVDRDALGTFFELSLGISALKQLGAESWALRCNPSSGNLHPTEGYALLPECPGVPAGLYHYASREHLLERRCALTAMHELPTGAFLAGLSSIHWREAWKYGERAFRYCQQDVGHALAALRYAAAALGWSARLLPRLASSEVAALLGLDRDADFAALDPLDREEADALLLVVPAIAGLDAAAARAEAACDAIVGRVRGGTWAGKPNQLSPEHLRWPALESASVATRKPRTQEPQATLESGLPPAAATGDAPAERLIRRRRSAVAMDGTTAISRDAFYRMLDRLLPRPGVPPWDTLPWAPRVHPLLLLHRVDGLEAGLYAFERRAAVHAELRAALRSDFVWQRPADCPGHLRLFLLAAGDVRQVAQLTSCHQEIAADGAFALGMLAEMRAGLERGPWWYRFLHWEAGILGQVLYLEAEAAGLGATGIGCFFDDAFHGTLGLGDDSFRDIYHFTVGGPLQDSRLTGLPPYPASIMSRP